MKVVLGWVGGILVIIGVGVGLSSIRASAPSFTPHIHAQTTRAHQATRNSASQCVRGSGAPLTGSLATEAAYSYGTGQIVATANCNEGHWFVEESIVGQRLKPWTTNLADIGMYAGLQVHGIVPTMPNAPPATVVSYSEGNGFTYYELLVPVDNQLEPLMFKGTPSKTVFELGTMDQPYWLVGGQGPFIGGFLCRVSHNGQLLVESYAVNAINLPATVWVSDYEAESGRVIRYLGSHRYKVPRRDVLSYMVNYC